MAAFRKDHGEPDVIDKMVKIDKADEFLDNDFVRGRKSWKKGENS